MEALLQSTEEFKMFIVAGPDSLTPAKATLSWMLDTGTQVTMISVNAAKRLKRALTPIQQMHLHCVSAFATQTTQLQMCRLDDLRLYDPSTKTFSDARSTMVLIHPSLTVHDCVMGMNTILDFGLVIATFTGKVRTSDGKSLTLFTAKQERIWRRRGQGPTGGLPANTRSGTRWNTRVETEYTEDDRQQLEKAKRIVRKREQEEEELCRRITNTRVGQHESGEEPDSPNVYQPCRRLVRVADLMDESSQNTDTSMVGATSTLSVSMDTEESAEDIKTPNKYGGIRKPDVDRTTCYICTAREHLKGEHRVGAGADTMNESGPACTDNRPAPLPSQIQNAPEEEPWTPMTSKAHGSGAGEERTKETTSAELMQRTRRLFDETESATTNDTRQRESTSTDMEQQTRALFESDSEESFHPEDTPEHYESYDSDDSAVLRKQARELFDKPKWNNTEWQQYAQLEHRRVRAMQREYEREYVQYQEMAKTASGRVPPYVWPHDRDIDRTGRAITEQWMNDQRRARANNMLEYVQYQEMAQTASGSVPPYVWPHDRDVDRTGRTIIEQWMNDQRKAQREAVRSYTPAFPDESNTDVEVTIEVTGTDERTAPPTRDKDDATIQIMQASVSARLHRTDIPPAKLNEGGKAKGHLLRDTVAEAAGYGSYLPVKVNGKLTIWHADSGASVSQISPDMLLEFDPPLRKVDEGEVHFNSAESASAAAVELYEGEVAIMHMESGICTHTVTTRVVCNPKVKKKTVLMGLNTLKDLAMSERYNDDTLIDAEGRPYRIPEGLADTVTVTTATRPGVEQDTPAPGTTTRYQQDSSARSNVGVESANANLAVDRERIRLWRIRSHSFRPGGGTR